MTDHYHSLEIICNNVDDLEKARTAAANRYDHLTRSGADKDGVERGLGLSDLMPEVQAAKLVRDGLIALEKDTIKALEKMMKAHPLGKFIAQAKGVGLKQGARLLAATGDPYIAVESFRDEEGKVIGFHEPRTRTVSQLWAYCGYSVKSGISQRRKKGEKSNWSAEARMRAYLIATQCVISGKDGKYEQLYRATREQYGNTPHTLDCVNCKVKAGEPLKPGHAHARALRRVSKELLKDLWIASREHHMSVNAELEAMAAGEKQPSTELVFSS